MVTGSSQPVGLEFVRQCLVHGDRVFAACRNPARVPVLADLRAAHNGLELVALDPADAASVADAVPVLERLTDSIDLLVIAPAEPPVHDRGGDERDDHFDTLSGTGLVERYRRAAVSPLLLVRTLLPFLVAGDNARILVVGDARGNKGTQQDGAGYATTASAAALHMLMRALAFDLREHRIPVCIGNAGHFTANPEAPDFNIPLDESASGLLATVETMSLEQSGSFFDWTGAARAH